MHWTEKKEENTTYQNLGDLAKTMVRGAFITLYAYIRKEEIFK